MEATWFESGRHVIGLFPSPFLRAPATIDRSLIASLIETFTSVADRGNDSSANLIHTGMATALARSDVPAARSLLTALAQVQPG